MANERKFYCLCEHNCKFETMTKEQILAAIAQAVDTGAIGDVDTGFVSRVIEQNKRGTLYFWVGTQAEYNAITEKADDCYYIITDDTTKADIATTIAQFADYLKTVEEKVNPFGTVLFEDTNGVEAGGEINFSASAHNCFLITIGSFIDDINIYCTKSKINGAFLINGVHSTLKNRYSPTGDGSIVETLNAHYRIAIELDDDTITHKVAYIQNDDDITFSSPIDGVYKVKKIVGLM